MKSLGVILAILSVIASCGSKTSSSFKEIESEWNRHFSLVSEFNSGHQVQDQQLRLSKGFFKELTGIDLPFYVGYIGTPVPTEMTKANQVLLGVWYEQHARFLQYDQTCRVIKHEYDPMVWVEVEAYLVSSPTDKSGRCEPPLIIKREMDATEGLSEGVGTE